MPANINSIAYTGETPWHGLGTKVDHVMTALEAIKAGGLDWEVEKVPLSIEENGGYKIAPKIYATRRKDSRAILGYVGEQYEILQNRAAFSFFDAVVGEKAAIYHTVGALGSGERLWLLAKLPQSVRVIGDDIVDLFLLLSNSHDGSQAVSVRFTSIRVVCQNTLAAAISEGKRAQYVRHTSNIGLRVSDVQKGLGIVNTQAQLFEQAAKLLVKTPLTADKFGTFLERTGLKPNNPEDLAKLSPRSKSIIDEVSDLFDRAPGNDLQGVKGSAWAALNAVTYYADYRRATRGASQDERSDNRIASLLWGSGAELKAKAFEAALSLAA